MSYEIEIGNPQAGLRLKFTVGGPEDGVEEKVATALGVLRRAGNAWSGWTRENETPEEKEMRLAIEENARLKRQVMEQQTIEMRRMLGGGS